MAPNNVLIYQGDGQTSLWPLPDGWAEPGRLMVSLTLPGQNERLAVAGSDYNLSGGWLVCMLPREGLLKIWPRAGQAAGMAGGQGLARSMLQAEAKQAKSAAPVYDVEPDQVSDNGPEATARLELLHAELAEKLAGQAEELARRLAEGMADALARLNARALLKEGELARATALARSGLPARGDLVLANGAPAGAWLTLPVAYYPQTQTLSLYCQGVLLAPGLDYEESGAAGEASSTIRMLLDLDPASRLTAIVAPVSSSEAQKQADKSRQQAASLMAQAREAESRAASLAANAQDDIITSQGWANASAKSAGESHKAALSAWDAAAQASIHARRPGISAVRDRADIHACSPGLFIINPHLTHAPTPFMGIWPAGCEHDIKWDGIFFIGGKPWPADPALPPAMPEKPAPDPVAATGQANDWIPCEHTHPQGCMCQGCIAARKGG